MKAILSKDITSDSDKLSVELEDTFLNKGDIQIIQIEKDDVLWRFVSQKNRPKYSAFWVDSETMSSLMSVFRSWGDYSETTKKEVVRDNQAVISDWSRLSWRMKVSFIKPVIAYYGIVSPQNLLDEKINVQSALGGTKPLSEYRIGGFKQYVIPSLNKMSDSKGEEIASIAHFAHI